MTDMSKEAMKLALEGAANYIDALGGDSRKYRQALALVNEVDQEQPAQQKPVAWRYDLKRGGSFEGVSTEYSRVKLSIGENWIPLYTSPQAQRTWVGLTDEERMDVLLALNWDKQLTHMDTAKAIEAKLKEKNNG